MGGERIMDAPRKSDSILLIAMIDASRDRRRGPVTSLLAIYKEQNDRRRRNRTGEREEMPPEVKISLRNVKSSHITRLK